MDHAAICHCFSGQTVSWRDRAVQGLLRAETHSGRERELVLLVEQQEVGRVNLEFCNHLAEDY